MRLLTAAEVRAEVARLPEQFREQAMLLLASAFDEGFNSGAGRLPRKNPFLVQPAAKTKGKK